MLCSVLFIRIVDERSEQFNGRPSVEPESSACPQQLSSPSCRLHHLLRHWSLPYMVDSACISVSAGPGAPLGAQSGYRCVYPRHWRPFGVVVEMGTPRAHILTERKGISPTEPFIDWQQILNWLTHTTFIIGKLPRFILILQFTYTGSRDPETLSAPSPVTMYFQPCSANLGPCSKVPPSPLTGCPKVNGLFFCTA